jgi:hypothetical protein
VCKVIDNGNAFVLLRESVFSLSALKICSTARNAERAVFYTLLAVLECACMCVCAAPRSANLQSLHALAVTMRPGPWKILGIGILRELLGNSARYMGKE